MRVAVVGISCPRQRKPVTIKTAPWQEREKRLGQAKVTESQEEIVSVADV